MILLWLLVIPFLGGLLTITVQNTQTKKAIAIVSLTLFLFVLIFIAQNVTITPNDSMWLVFWQTTWISYFNINFSVGLSGLSFWLLVLLGIVGIFAVIKARDCDRKFYFASLLWAIFGSVGVLIAADVFLFFVCWEVALLPIYFMVLFYGGKDRFRAGLRYICYTQAGGLVLLATITALVTLNYSNTKILTFDYRDLIANSLSLPVQNILLLGFLLAFLIKIPVIPFHTWIAPLFSEAPSTSLLVGVLVKLAVFGLIRFSWPMLPLAASNFSSLLSFLGAVTIIYGALLAFREKDPKRLLAYATVSHGGLLLIGVSLEHEAAYIGTLMLLITGALSMSALVILIDLLYRDLLDVDIGFMGGYWSNAPRYATLLCSFLFAAMGVPFFGNFVGEWLILWSIFSKMPIISVIAAIGVVCSVVYSLWLFQRLCFGQETKEIANPRLFDLSLRELSIYTPILVMLIILGFCPALIISTPDVVLTKYESNP